MVLITTLDDVKAKIKSNLGFIESEYGVKEIGVFGSTARGDSRDDSDIDILVDFSRSLGFIKFIKLENYLTKILNKQVDLISKKALKPIIKDDILKEVCYV